MVLQWTRLLLQLYKDLSYSSGSSKKRIFHIRRVPASVFSWVLFSVTRRYKFWNVCVLEIGDILSTLSYYINFFCGLFILLFIFFDALLIIQDSRLGRGDFCSRPLFFKLVVMRCFSIIAFILMAHAASGVQRCFRRGVQGLLMTYSFEGGGFLSRSFWG